MDIIRLEHNDVINMLPDRDPFTHKGDYGRILLLCGSKGYTGAAALSAMGALRAGAGLVFLGVPECIYEIEAIKLTEPIVFSLPDRDGLISARAVDQLMNMTERMDAVLIGPGLGCSQDTLEVTRAVLDKYHGPVVLDADGINVLKSHKDILRRRTSPTVLTPHNGEFIRIGGSITEDRVSDAAKLANDLGCIVLLKGYNSVITDGKRCYINTTGNPGMAVGGSGDVLSGMIVSLMGQGIEPVKAAACGAWLHGAAGDLCARRIGQYGMLPTDMLNVLPRLMK